MCRCVRLQVCVDWVCEIVYVTVWVWETVQVRLVCDRLCVRV